MTKLLEHGCDNGLFKIKIDGRTLWGYTDEPNRAIRLGDTPEQGIGDDRSDLWFVKRKPDGVSYEGPHIIIGLGPSPKYWITYYQEWMFGVHYSYFRLEENESNAQIFLNSKGKLITEDRDNQTLHAVTEVPEHLRELDAYQNTSWNVELQKSDLCVFTQERCPNPSTLRDPSVAEFTLVTGCPTPSTPVSPANSSKNSKAHVNAANAANPASSSKKSGISNKTLLQILGLLAGFVGVIIIIIIVVMV